MPGVRSRKLPAPAACVRHRNLPLSLLELVDGVEIPDAAPEEQGVGPWERVEKRLFQLKAACVSGATAAGGAVSWSHGDLPTIKWLFNPNI